MREYLALHNVNLLTFWVFVFLWFLGVVVCWVLVKMWFINMKKYKGDSMPNALFTLTVLVVLAVLLPVLAMGLWHFINMVLQLTVHSDLYCLLDMKFPAV